MKAFEYHIYTDENNINTSRIDILRAVIAYHAGLRIEHVKNRHIIESMVRF